MRTILVTILVMILLSGAAFAHGEYTGMKNRHGQLCCDVTDCAKIPRSAITEGGGGFTVHLQPGQHPMVVNGPTTVFFPYADVIPSWDGEPHVCLFPTQHDGRCLVYDAGGS